MVLKMARQKENMDQFTFSRTTTTTRREEEENEENEIEKREERTEKLTEMNTESAKRTFELASRGWETEETVVAEEPKNATLVEEEPEPEPVVEAPVEKKPGSLEAQRAALSTIAELQREAFFAADARAEELLDANSTVLNATRAVIETSEILAGLDDDQCTVMSNGDSAENATELAEFIEEEVAATDR